MGANFSFLVCFKTIFLFEIITLEIRILVNFNCDKISENIYRKVNNLSATALADQRKKTA
jgi:hypothetical protein